MQEQELFRQYELKGWQFSPRLYKILGASVLINVLGFFLMAQSNFLTGKTCDSPLASGVCSVLDALYVGSVLAETDPRYVEENYMKTELESADITYVDLSNWQPLEYPEGYFAMANPQDQMTTQMAGLGDPSAMFPPSGINPGITSGNPTIGTPNDLTTVPQVLPTPNDKAIMGSLPNSVTGGGTRKPKRYPKINNPMSNTSPTSLPPDGTVAENNANKENKQDKTEDAVPTEIPSLEDIKINKKPLQDLADMALAQWASKEIDLNQQFIVVMNGALTKEGRLDPKKSVWVEKEIKGDPKMVELAKEAVESVGESGWLYYLQKFGIEKIKITLAQDNDKVVAYIESEQKSPEKANSLSSLINTTIMGAKMAIKGDDEKTLIQSAKSTSSGKVFILNFEIPKPKAQEMINRRLQEAQAKQNQQKTSGSQSADTNQAISK